MNDAGPGRCHRTVPTRKPRRPRARPRSRRALFGHSRVVKNLPSRSEKCQKSDFGRLPLQIASPGAYLSPIDAARCVLSTGEISDHDDSISSSYGHFKLVSFFGIFRNCRKYEKFIGQPVRRAVPRVLKFRSAG